MIIRQLQSDTIYNVVGTYAYTFMVQTGEFKSLFRYGYMTIMDGKKIYEA